MAHQSEQSTAYVTPYSPDIKDPEPEKEDEAEDLSLEEALSSL